MTYLIRSEAVAVQDEVIYRCIHAACARPLPRRVNFCPYCGTGQHAGVDNPAHVVLHKDPLDAAPAPAADDAPTAEPQYVAPPPSSHAVPPAASQPVAPAAAQPAPRIPAAARPPQREPVRLRYWLLALALLWAIWITAKPTTKKIDARIDQAVALAADCKFSEAQSELIALRSTKATPEQLTRLQAALNEAVPVCERKRARARAWNETSLAVDNALASSMFDKALGRLGAFTKRWGDDAESRSLKAKITAMRDASNPRAEDVAPPAAIPPARSSTALGAAQQAQSVRNLIAEADRELAQGNYRAAADKMETCITMVDAGNRECLAVKARVERLHSDMLRCVAGGSDWVNDRCQ